MIRNWNEFDNALKQIALIDLDIIEAGRARDLACIEAESRYKAATSTRDAKRKSLVCDMEKFYRANRREVEADGSRSKRLLFGIAGIRKSAPALRTLKGFTWVKVVDAIKREITCWETYIECKYSVKKDALKKSKLDADKLAVLGCKIVQEEEFFIETFPDKAIEEAA